MDRLKPIHFVLYPIDRLTHKIQQNTHQYCRVVGLFTTAVRASKCCDKFNCPSVDSCVCHTRTLDLRNNTTNTCFIITFVGAVAGK